jgi:uncharacterized protein (TIGR00661 family)
MNSIFAPLTTTTTKMRILYALHGDDWGAIQRAKALIPFFFQRAHVDILFYGSDPRFSMPYPVQFSISKNGRFGALKKIGVLFSVPTQKYDLVISDREPVASWSALLQATPCIQLNAFSSQLYSSESSFFKKIWMRIKKEHYCPANEQISLRLNGSTNDFFPPKNLIENENQKVQKNHLTVRLPQFSEQKILQVLFQFDREWQVFTDSNYSYRIQNVSFQPFEEKSFAESLCSSLGVLTHNDLQICAEALALNKKLLVIACHKEKQHPVFQELKSIKASVLDDLDLIHYRSIRNWLDKPNSIVCQQYPQNEALVQSIFQLYEKVVVGQSANVKQRPIAPNIGWARFFW